MPAASWPMLANFSGLHQRLLGRGQLLVRCLDLFERPAELVDGVRQAHLVLGQPLVDRNGVFLAGVVTARAAVQLVGQRKTCPCDA